jgi:hypothetical protein
LKAVPQISAEERKTTSMPDELVFIYLNRDVLAANHMEDETMKVTKNIIRNRKSWISFECEIK